MTSKEMRELVQSVFCDDFVMLIMDVFCSSVTSSFLPSLLAFPPIDDDDDDCFGGVGDGGDDDDAAHGDGDGGDDDG